MKEKYEYYLKIVDSVDKAVTLIRDMPRKYIYDIDYLGIGVLKRR